MVSIILLLSSVAVLTRSETIQCSSAACANTTIVCDTTAAADSTCTIRCNETNSCAHSTVLCAPHTHCNILCNQNRACEYMTVVCPSGNSTRCNLRALWPYSMYNAQVHCQGGSQCNLTCNGMGSCLNATVNGFYQHGTQSVLRTGRVEIGCNDNARDNATQNTDFACKNLNVFCRQSSSNTSNDEDEVQQFCKLRSLSVNTQPAPHTSLNFYAVNSWYDIDLSEYATQVQSSSQMHCGADFGTSCAIANISDASAATTAAWNCANDTSLCYVWYPTQAPLDGDDDNTNYALIFGLCIGLFFLFLIIVCVVCYLKKDEQHIFGGAGKDDDVDGDEVGVHRNEAKQKLHALANAEELDTLKTPLSKSTKSEDAKVMMMTEEEEHHRVDADQDEDSESEAFQEYRRMMQLVFYSFAGYQPWAKKTGLYMHTKELQIFLDIVNITDEVEDVLRLIDNDIEDGRLTVNEWMQYFCDKQMNASVFVIKRHIEEQDTWALLCKALRIIEKNDIDHSEKLEYAEFESFGTEIGLNAQETELLWDSMDTDQSGAVNVVELFEWFRLQLHQQTGRITQERQPSLLLRTSDFQDVGEFQSAVRMNHENECFSLPTSAKPGRAS